MQQPIQLRKGHENVSLPCLKMNGLMWICLSLNYFLATDDVDALWQRLELLLAFAYHYTLQVVYEHRLVADVRSSDCG